MKSGKRCASLALLAIGCATVSACGQQERPRTASDFCLVDQRLTVEAAPGIGADDPGNQYDTDETVEQVLAHNEVHDRLC